MLQCDHTNVLYPKQEEEVEQITIDIFYSEVFMLAKKDNPQRRKLVLIDSLFEKAKKLFPTLKREDVDIIENPFADAYGIRFDIPQESTE